MNPKIILYLKEKITRITETETQLFPIDLRVHEVKKNYDLNKKIGVKILIVDPSPPQSHQNTMRSRYDQSLY